MGKVTLYINGRQHTVSDDLPPDLSLSDYIRDVAGLTGTKVMCGEGGCGTCVVAVTKVDPVTQKSATHAINSCLCPVFTCHGWHITTVEGLGSQREGLHAIQERVANGYGSQCGFCTPGMVMSTYSLLCEKSQPTAEDIDHSLDGNICRCTGYRPILESMRTFAGDGSRDIQPIDIEDLNKFHCPSNGTTCSNGLSEASCVESVQCMRLREGVRWYQPTTLPQLYSLMKELGTQAKIVAGDTAKGIIKDAKDVSFRLDVSRIEELYEVQMCKGGLSVGAGISLSSFMSVLEEKSKQQGYAYFKQQLVPLLFKVASTPIRNVASLAGNLMIKHADRAFPSDVFTALEGLGASIVVGSEKGEENMDLPTFLQCDMTNKVVVSTTLPPLPANTHYTAAKVGPRAANCYAYVNAGILLPVENNFTINAQPRIVLGGLGRNVVHARKTEAFLEGKMLSDVKAVKEAISLLKEELDVETSDLGPDSSYKLNVAANLLFKAISALTNPTMSLDLGTALSTGSVDYQTKDDSFPLTKPMPKIDAHIQATGEALYTADKPQVKGQLEAYIVTSTVAKATIDKIDTTRAMKSAGVHNILTAKDIPGENNYSEEGEAQEFLATTRVHYVGQPIAVVIADTRIEAKKAASLMNVTYSNRDKPILDVKDAIEKDYMHKERPMLEKKLGDTEAAFLECDDIIEGSVDMGSQYHFYLEPHSVVVSPNNGELNVWATTVWPDETQNKITNILGGTANRINIQVPRLGGSFGGKHEAMKLVAGIGALAATVSNRTVRTVYDLSQCMHGPGRRFGVFAKYRVGRKGAKFHALDVDCYIDLGWHSKWAHLDLFLHKITDAFEPALSIPNITVRGHAVKTDHAITGAMRAPGPMPASIVTNTILDHVARTSKTDIVTLIDDNLIQDGQELLSGVVVEKCTMDKVWAELKLKSDYQARQQEVDKFNKDNKYIKRGLSCTVANYWIGGWPGGAQSAYVTIYNGDGSVAIAISGVEFGQGLFTKCAQVASQCLDIPMEKIRVKPTDSVVGSNSSVTAGSKDSEMCARTVMECCKILNGRLDEVRKTEPGISWEDLLLKCQMSGVNLAAHCKFNDVAGVQYGVYGAAAAEAEVDLLTGQSRIVRVDLAIDFGESMNPENDRGQIEGALMQGLGQMFMEHEVWDSTTGRLLTDSTWEYKPPTAFDIPTDMRIYFLKDSPNTLGIVSAKAVGEPPIIMTPVFLNAVRGAIAASREERGLNPFCRLDVPATIDRIQAATELSASDL